VLDSALLSSIEFAVALPSARPLLAPGSCILDSEAMVSETMATTYSEELVHIQAADGIELAGTG